MNKLIIVLLLIGAVSTLSGKPVNQNLFKGSGFITFNEHDFPAKILNYPISINEKWRAKYDEVKSNRMFMHTFQYNISKGCKVTKAIVSLKFKNLAAAYNNDILGFVENGKLLYKTKIWVRKEASQAVKTLSFDLSRLPKVGSILNSLNDGDFSLYVQDDTSVDFVKLEWTQSGNSCQ